MNWETTSYDVVFHGPSLGITFTPEKDDDGAVVDGFYQLNGNLLEAELGRIISLNDRVIAIQGKSVLGESFKYILKKLKMQKRPVKITFQRMKEPSAVEISLNEVLSKENNLNIYLSFLKRKSLYLSSIWLSFILDLEHALRISGDAHATSINSIWNKYMDDHGEFTRYMFCPINVPHNDSMSVSEKIYYLSNLKVEIRERIRKFSWVGFVQSPE